jgi:hypothetical protein
MIRRLWEEERWSLLAIGVASGVAAVAWRATTRPMGDSFSYRVGGIALRDGWHHALDRTPGYPALLWATGSLHGETHVLFVTQLALHAGSVLLVVRMAQVIGLSRRTRVLVAVLLVLPPEMVPVVYAGSEALTQFLVVLAAWAFVRSQVGNERQWLLLAGVSLGVAAWVRPSLAIVALVIAPLVWWAARRAGRHPAVELLSVAAPALALVVLLLVLNGARFGSPALTPLTGWYLSSRTSTYVQDLPASDEPGRTILVRERDRQLGLGNAVDAPNYAFAVRGELERAMGFDRQELDRWMLRVNLRLIAHHPFEYKDAVDQASVRYVAPESQPASRGLGKAQGWANAGVHLGLTVAFLVQAFLAPGLLWHRRRQRLTLVMAWCLAASLAVAAVAVLTETGTSRLRVPTDPLLVLVGVTGWWVMLDELRRRQPEPGGAEVPTGSVEIEPVHDIDARLDGPVISRFAARCPFGRPYL